LLARKRNNKDGRSTVLKLTVKGEKEFSAINRASGDQLTGMLSTLTNAEVKKLLNHMAEIRRIIS
jgi:DNA-binding MarR family transcriptional regulator